MEDGSPVPLSGIVEIDETWIGGRAAASKGSEVQQVDGAGRRSNAAARFALRSAKDRAESPKSPTGASSKTPLTRRPSSSSPTPTTPGTNDRLEHQAPQGRSRREEWVRGIVHTNTIEGVWSLFKRSVVGTYHQLSAKHLPAYLDEMAFRFNNRENAYLFRDTLLRMIEGETLPYEELVHG